MWPATPAGPRGLDGGGDNKVFTNFVPLFLDFPRSTRFFHPLFLVLHFKTFSWRILFEGFRTALPFLHTSLTSLLNIINNISSYNSISKKSTQSGSTLTALGMHLAKFFRAAVFFRGARVHQLHTWHNRATVALSTANLSPRNCSGCAFLGLGKLFPPVKSLSSVRTGEICIIFSSWLSSPEDLRARRKGGEGGRFGWVERLFGFFFCFGGTSYHLKLWNVFCWQILQIMIVLFYFHLLVLKQNKKT